MGRKVEKNNYTFTLKDIDIFHINQTYGIDNLDSEDTPKPLTKNNLQITINSSNFKL